MLLYDCDLGCCKETVGFFAVEAGRLQGDKGKLTPTRLGVPLPMFIFPREVSTVI